MYTNCAFTDIRASLIADKSEKSIGISTKNLSHGMNYMGMTYVWFCAHVLYSLFILE